MYGFKFFVVIPALIVPLVLSYAIADGVAGSWAENPGDNGGIYNNSWQHSRSLWNTWAFDDVMESVSVRATVSDGHGHVYVGGTFRTVGSRVVNSIARLDTASDTWQPLDKGVNGFVNTLVSDKAGNIYAGGLFSSAGDTPASNVALWNASTSSWESLSTGLDGEVFALTIGEDGAVYASVSTSSSYLETAQGYHDYEPGSTENNYVVRWSLSTQSWSRIGAGMDHVVRALAVDSGGRVYAGGGFKSADGKLARHLVIWDAANQTWEEFAGGVSEGTEDVTAIVIDADDNVYVGGEFHRAGDVSTLHVAKWDVLEGRWEPLGRGFNTQDNGYWHPDNVVDSMALGKDGHLYIGGNFYSENFPVDSSRLPNRSIFIQNIVGWNIESEFWFALDFGIQGRVSAITVHDDGRVYAGGRYGTAGRSTITTNFSRYFPVAGGEWEELGSGIDGRILALAEDSVGNVFIGGDFKTINSSAARNFARKSVMDTSWSLIFPEDPIRSGLSGLAVYSIVVDDNDDIYAAGSFEKITDSGNIVKNLAKYSPATRQWDAVGEGTDGWVTRSLGDKESDGWITDLVIGDEEYIYAIGRFDMVGSVPARNVARWNKSLKQWEALGDGPDTARDLDLVAYSSGNLFVAHGSTIFNTLYEDVLSVHRWSEADQSWETFGSTIDKLVDITGLVVDHTGAVYVSIYDRQFDSPDSSAVLRWSQELQSWVPVGDSFTGRISSLIIDSNNRVVAGGNFTDIGNTKANNLAIWNAQAEYWQPLSQELDGPVEALFPRKAGGFYAAGSFSVAGDIASPGFGVWSPEPATTVVPVLELADAGWRQIALPCDAGSENTVAQIFGDDALGSYGTDWLLWGYDAAAEKYTTVNEQSKVSPGEGYWIFQRSGATRAVDVPASCTATATITECPNSNGCFEVPLVGNPQASLFQMIGYPFATPGRVGETYVVTDTPDCVHGCEIGSVEANQYVYPLFYNFDGTSYKLLDTGRDLSPWEGYWTIVRPAAAGANARLAFGQ